MEQQNTQPTFGRHIPPYLRDELMKARQQQGKADEIKPQEEATVEPQVETQQTGQSTDTTTIENQPEPQKKPQAETVPHSDDDNDVKAWKGRLKKEQAERQQLNARLIEEAEARSRAEARIKELEQQTQNKAHQPKTQPDPKGISDADLEELKMLSPDLYLKLKEARHTQTAVNTETPPQTTIPAQPTQQQAQQPVMSERDRIWYAEIQREIPEIQGSLGDQGFMDFAKSKTDWTGETGLDLINRAGMSKDVRLIPAIRNLLDEYSQSKTTTPTQVTVAPQKTATVKAKVNTPKTMTRQDEAKAEMLSRQGKTAELKQFLSQFKQ